MALIIEIKVNRKKIGALVAERYDSKKTGVNAYKIYVLDSKNKILKEGLVAHLYEDGAIKLVERVAKEFQLLRLP